MKALHIIETFGGNSGVDFSVSCNMPVDELTVVLKHVMSNEVIRTAIFAAAIKFAIENRMDLGAAQKTAMVNLKSQGIDVYHDMNYINDGDNRRARP